MLTADRIAVEHAEVYKKRTPILVAALAATRSDIERLDVIVTETFIIQEEFRKIGSFNHLHPSKRVLLLYLKEKDQYMAALAKVGHLMSEASRILNNLN